MTSVGLDVDAVESLAVHCYAAGVHEIDLIRRGSSLRLRLDADWVPVEADVPQVPVTQVSFVRSPGVGVFRSHHPTTGHAIVEAGSQIGRGSTVAVLQVGSLLRAVVASADGRLGPALVADGAIVGYDMPLYSLS